jgi:hypothetical protein
LKRLREQRRRHSIDASNLEYICYLSNKHGVDPYTLLQSFFQAVKRDTVTCGNLTIERRRSEDNYTIFLVTREQDIIAQMGIKNELWENPAKTKTTYAKLVNSPPLFFTNLKRE